MLLPGLVLLLAFTVWVLAVLGAHLRTVEAARAGARAAARGEPAAEVADRVRDVLGARAEVTVRRSADEVVVELSHTLAPPAPLLNRLLPDVTVTARGVTAAEPGAVRP